MGLAILRRAEQQGAGNDAAVPLMMPALEITAAGDADLGLIRAVAAGQPVSIGPALLAAVQQRCTEARQVLRDGRLVYGVNTGMGALSSVRLTEEAAAFSPAQPAAGAGHRRAAVAERRPRSGRSSPSGC